MSRPPLPIDEVISQIVDSIHRHPSLVLVAPPGAGKTTGVPLALLDADPTSSGKIIVAQPRRIAARSAAARLASVYGSVLGGEIGYQVRFDHRVSKRTRLSVVTTGILLRQLQTDPWLSDIGTVLLDEFHERSLEIDVCLGMLCRLQQTVRPDLKLIVMSATLHAGPIAAQLGNAPTIHSEGRAYPVSIEWMPGLGRETLDEHVGRALQEVLQRRSGDALVFLPGVGEIHRAIRTAESLGLGRDAEFIPLYGDLSPEAQDRAIQPTDHRKVVFATNVAETSVTIPGITIVIDTGLARVSHNDPHTGLPRLDLQPISQASATQRAGRAGRVAAGHCVRLYAEAAYRARGEYDLPEILRGDLTGAVLQLAGWDEYDVDAFPWLTPPRPEAVTSARKTLDAIGALAEGRITPLGKRILDLPLHPRIAGLLLAGERARIAPQAALAAALLTERDPFRSGSSNERGPVTRTPYRTRSDLADRVAVLEGDNALRGVLPLPHAAAVTGLRRVQRQLLQLLESPPTDEHQPNQHVDGDREHVELALTRCLLAAMPDRLAKRRSTGNPRGVMVGGRGVQIVPPSGVVEGELVLCIDMEDGGADAKVRMAAAVDPSMLDPALLKTRDEVFFAPTDQQVVARRRTYWCDLVIAETATMVADEQAVASLLVQEAIARWPAAFPDKDESLNQNLNRWRSLHLWRPELELPALDDGLLQSILPQLAAGKRSFSQLRQAAWWDFLLGVLSFEQRNALERLCPERLELPNGFRAKLQYEAGKPPILAARIQDLFGCKQTPSICDGRIAVLLHLLGPNHRPQQVTSDLASFWVNTYPQVRKDLRRRYPKHSWPENP
jgi:ATP-dependent helicase HrpB